MQARGARVRDRPKEGVAVPRYALVCSCFLLAVAGASPRRRRPPTSRRAGCSRTAATYRSQGKLKQALDNFSIVVAQLPRHRLGRPGAARDRALPHRGGGRRGQGARRLRPGDQGARAQRRCAGRLLPPGPAHPRARHPAPRSTTRSRSSRASRRSTRAATGCRARCTAAAMAHRRAGRYARGRGPQPSRLARVPGQRRGGAARSSRSASALALQGEPRQAMEEYQQVRNRFPESEWAAARARADHRPLSAVRRAEAGLRPGRRRSRSQPASC